MKILMRCVCILVLLGIFTVTSFGQFLHYGMFLEAEEFYELRAATDASDEEAFASVMKNKPLPAGYRPINVDEGRRMFELMDSYYLTDFSDRAEYRTFGIKVAYDRSSDSVEHLVFVYYFEGFDINIEVEYDSFRVNPAGDGAEEAFSLKTSEGESLLFYKDRYRDNRYLASLKNQQVDMYFTLYLEKDCDISFVSSVLGGEPIDYCTVRALTMGVEEDLSDIVFVDKPSAFPWLWVGIGGGAVVAICGAAVTAVMIRKKRRRAAAASSSVVPDGAEETVK